MKTASPAMWIAFAGAVALFLICRRQSGEIEGLTAAVADAREATRQAIQREAVRGELETWTTLHGCLCRHGTNSPVSIEEDLTAHAGVFLNRASWGIVQYVDAYPSASALVGSEWRKYLLTHLPDDTGVVSRAKECLRRSQERNPNTSLHGSTESRASASSSAP